MGTGGITPVMKLNQNQRTASSLLLGPIKNGRSTEGLLVFDKPATLRQEGRIPMVGKTLTVFLFAVLIWGFCGAIIAFGRQYFTMDTTLIIHAIGAPLGAAFFSMIYFRYFSHTSPFATAAAFVAISLALDFFVVSMLIEKNFEMFQSVLGVWLPQALIFSATYLTGLVVMSPRKT